MGRGIEFFLEKLGVRCADRKTRLAVKRLLRRIGYDPAHWARVVMYREAAKLIEELEPKRLDVLEISPGDSDAFGGFAFRSRRTTTYPEFDICEHRLTRSFDLIIADQIFEHLLWPQRGAMNVLAMLRPGGYFFVAVPFLIRVHDGPFDCTRWTEVGLKHFLASCGFPLEGIRSGSWGNRACVKANLRSWARRGWFRSLRNEPNFPVTVWAMARKADSP